MEPVPTPTAGCSKWDIRQSVWDHIERNNLADFPLPPHHRIPNFKNSRLTGRNIAALEAFRTSREVKVDPDKPLEGVRLAALQARKTLLVPTPRLRTGLFNRITPPPGAGTELLRICSTSQGVRDYSAPLGLDDAVRVDLVVVGSVAVSEKGWRIGKGEGFADMEYAMMVAMGAVTDQTTVVTVVHDCQVLDFSEELLGDHDLTVDVILTPTRVIKTDCARPKPTGIIWSKISWETMEKIPILKKLREKERRLGKDVTLKEERHSSGRSSDRSPSFPPPTKGDTRSLPAPPSSAPAARSLPAPPSSASADRSLPAPPNSAPADRKDSSTVYIGDIPSTTRVSELKNILRSLDALPAHLAWQGAQRRAFLSYSDPAHAELVLAKLEGLHIGQHPVRVEMARGQRSRGNVPEGHRT